MRPESNAIWWLKRNLRLSDNPVLSAALENGQNVVPILIIEPSATNPKLAPETSAFHFAAWLEAVKGLRKNLQEAGGDLCVLHGEVVELFAELRRRIEFTKVFSHEEVGTHRTFQRDKAFAAWCKANKVTWKEHKQTGVFRGFTDRNKRGSIWINSNRCVFRESDQCFGHRHNIHLARPSALQWKQQSCYRTKCNSNPHRQTRYC